MEPGALRSTARKPSHLALAGKRQEESLSRAQLAAKRSPAPSPVLAAMRDPTAQGLLSVRAVCFTAAQLHPELFAFSECLQGAFPCKFDLSYGI